MSFDTMGHTIADRVTEVLRRHLLQVDSGFEPGRRIDVRELADAMSVSVTPVKEALRRLEANGLVVYRPRRGVFVRTITPEGIRELIMIRAGLEVTSLRMCAPTLADDRLQILAGAIEHCKQALEENDSAAYHEADMNFHRAIVESCHSKRLIGLYQSCLDQWQVLDGYCPPLSANERVSLWEHEELLRVARGGDMRRLESELWAHWERGTSRLLDRYRVFVERAGPPEGDGRENGESPGYKTEIAARSV